MTSILSILFVFELGFAFYKKRPSLVSNTAQMIWSTEEKSIINDTDWIHRRQFRDLSNQLHSAGAARLGGAALGCGWVLRQHRRQA